MALCNAASVTTKSAVSMINFITDKSKWADCSKHYETELIFCVLDGQLTMTLPFSWTPQPVTQWTKKGVTRYYQHSQSPHTKILNAIGWLQLAPLWPDCYVMCRLREPKCSPVLRSFLALTCMVPGRGGSSSPWRGVCKCSSNLKLIICWTTFTKTVHFVFRVSEKLKNLKLRGNNYLTIHVVTRVNVTETSETKV